MSTEYKRPTADSDPGSGVLYSSTAYTASSSMSAVYSGKSGVGPTGSSSTISASDSSGTGSHTTSSSRAFKTWQSASGGYASLTLYASVATTLTNTGDTYLYYSTNSGSTWTLFRTI